MSNLKYIDLRYHAFDGTDLPTSIPYSQLDGKPPSGPHVVLTEIPYTAHSDYGGCAVERSNHRVLLNDPEIAPLLVEAYGGYGSSGLFFVGTETPEALRDVMAGLDSYPLIDDDDHSALECELESEAWDSYGRRDFQRALRKAYHADEERIDDATDATLDAMWRDASDRYNLNGGTGYQIETGGTVYFYIDLAVKRITRADLVTHGILE